LAGHPWVFADAIEVPVGIEAGHVVELLDCDEQFMGMAFYNPHSSIALRILTRKREVIDASWISSRLKAAIERRKFWASPEHEIQRLVAFEGDGLPGLIVDRYGEHMIFQILSAGMEPFREVIIDTLKAYAPQSIIERSDEKVREKEGLEERKALVHGTLPSKDWSVKEHGLSYTVDLWEGHKTGFYIDQSQNRKTLVDYGRGVDGSAARVLNCFSYTGGFSLSVLKGGAREVISVDASMPALEVCEKNMALNGFGEDRHSCLQGDVFDILEHFHGRESFDGVILDPPKFASRKQHMKNALKGYRELNALGMRLIPVGGWLATFTCSGRVSREDFLKAVEKASLKLGQSYVVEQWLSQAPDHSVRLGFGESLYLKGLLLRRVA
jgi:23S rRNA (cytosine1962-C5)-methyltransferase